MGSWRVFRCPCEGGFLKRVFVGLLIFVITLHGGNDCCDQQQQEVSKPAIQKHGRTVDSDRSDL